MYFFIAYIVCFTFTQRYILNDEQEFTLLIEATVHGHINIVKHLLDNFNANIDAPGKLKHSSIEFIYGVSALWCAVSKYIYYRFSLLLSFINHKQLKYNNIIDTF